jgi:nucleoside-diphosphate-sugar epimerase
MERIAVIGANGFVGKALVKVLEKSGKFQIQKVTRENYEDEKLAANEYDIIIHTAMPSKRWWAANNPLADFDATVRITADILYNWKYKKLVLISSVSARAQSNHPYGRHKHVAEVLVHDHSSDHLIFRLGGLYGDGLDKGVIFDMINGNEIFMSGNSAFNYIDVYKAAELIVKRLHQKGQIDIGAKDTITIKAIAEHFNFNVQFGEREEYQNTENPDEDFPEAIFNQY